MSISENLRHLGWCALMLGLINAVCLSVIMVPTFLLGVSPFPKPPSLAFAETLLGHGLPLPVGLPFHVAYVTIWSVVFVILWYPRLSPGPAFRQGTFARSHIHTVGRHPGTGTLANTGQDPGVGCLLRQRRLQAFRQGRGEVEAARL